MASTTAGTVVAYFATEAQAEDAVSALQNAGFSSNQIGIAVNSPTTAGSGRSGLAETSGTQHSHAAATVAGKTEGAWDRFKSFFDGSGDGDIEPYADERARGTQTGYDSHEITPEGGYYHDDFGGTLGSMDVNGDRSRYFGHRLGSGAGAVVTVSASGRETEAEALLTRAGGDVGTGAESYDYGTGTAGEEQRIQLLGEVLRVHKDRISRGEVRIRKQVITDQQTVQVPVTREELVIERIPVQGRAATGTIGADSEIRIPLSEEIASVDTDTVVREEIAIGKRAVENVREVGGAVRHEELEVEDTTTTTTPGVTRADKL